jgi:uncharacterized protein YciI
MFAVILKYKKSLEEVERYTASHRAFLDRYYATGILIMSGRQTPPTGGVIIANAKSREQLDAMLAEDPFNTEGIADYEIYEFTPGKYQAALKELIEV